MVFSVNLGVGGPAGWNLLQRTETKSKQVLARDPVVKREIDYYRDRIQHVETADDLVGDYRLLSVALKAHGLETEINYRGLIKKVLESDLSDPRSLANRLSDKRYLRLAESFDFNRKASGGIDTSIPFEDRVGLKGYSREILGFASRQKDKIAALAQDTRDDFSFWGKVRKDVSLRKVFTVALNLPDDFGKSTSFTDSSGEQRSLVTTRSRPAVEKAKILSALKDVTGAESFKELADPGMAEKLIRAYVFNNRDAIIQQKIEADATAQIGSDPRKPDPKDDFLRNIGLTGFDKGTIRAVQKSHDAMQKIFEVKDRDSTITFALLRNDDLQDVLNSAFDLGEDFNGLSFLKKEEAFTEKAKNIFNVESLTEFADPAKLEQVFRRHVFRLRTAEKPDDPSKTADPVETVATAYLDREFESRIGQSDQTLRLALNARREIARIAEAGRSDRANWYELLSNPPLRQVFQGAFNFGPHIGALDVDRQVEEFTSAARRVLGTDSFTDISRKETTERLLRTYLARSQTSDSFAVNRYGAALTLLANPGPIF
ncbi:DUF1217 domain-containing protein [Paracoccus onubensis]|uniref:DUF1217 domain-containing protein n=1 Tax=Paracoccus onubensis TaxID=1675788 RepID=A0A418SRG7_9RHOB|nr:DUF1217 domain-containing protein [Paracoccus onubensis]RJE83482.1 DUF1217 domain-containing protein [Paracoccus onubensis]